VWIVRECDDCGCNPASLRCDACHLAVCSGCVTILEHTIEGYNEERYQHLCEKCTSNISVDGTTYTGAKLVVMHPKDTEDPNVSRR